MPQVRQKQLDNSDTYDDTLAAGSSLETQSNVEGDLNAARSQLNRIIGLTNWYDAPGADLTQLTTLNDLMIVCNATVLTDVVVGASENWVILSVASSEAPTKVNAQVLTTAGAITAVAATSGAGFASNELVEVTGQTAITPNNLVVVVDAATNQPLQSGGKDILALLQVESTGTDGAAFNDTSGGNRVKLSFVIYNGTNNDLIACPIVDIENKTVRYNYLFRIELPNVDQNCFTSDRGIIDQAASVDVTLSNAIANQSGTAAQTSKNIEWTITDANTLEFKTVAGSNLVSLAPDTTDVLTVGNADGGTTVNFDSGTGGFTFDSTAAATSPLFQMATSGTNGDNVNVYIGTIDPSAGAGVAAPEGSIFFRGTASAGQAWLKTDSDQTGWERIAVLSDVAAETLAQTLAAGNTTGGTDIVVSSGDQITSAAGVDLAINGNGSTTPGAVNIYAGSDVSGTAAGKAATLGGGDSFADGQVGASATLLGGSANSTVGDKSGSAIVQGGNGGGTDADGGDVELKPGTGAGTGSKGALKLDYSTYPAADGSSGYVLSTNGAGVLSWTAQTAGGTARQEGVTTETITGTDTTLADTLNNTPVSNASVKLALNGIVQEQGAGKDYTVSGTNITWLAASGTAVDMDTSDVLVAWYES